ncbi:hypothetical protein SE957_22540 [Escherichia coli]|nr:hypothetical protein [Escherichia coli]
MPDALRLSGLQGELQFIEFAHFVGRIRRLRRIRQHKAQFVSNVLPATGGVFLHGIYR